MTMSKRLMYAGVGPAAVLSLGIAISGISYAANGGSTHGMRSIYISCVHVKAHSKAAEVTIAPISNSLPRVSVRAAGRQTIIISAVEKPAPNGSGNSNMMLVIVPATLPRAYAGQVLKTTSGQVIRQC